jgi:hypothetical protein
LKPLRRELRSASIAALVVAAFGALAVAPRRAAGATDTQVRLDYRADEQSGCVGEDEVRRMVAEQLGHDPFRPDADRRVTITITKTDTGYQGRIVWTEADGKPVGERRLSSRNRDCQEIAANVAFAVALQVELVERAASNEAAEAPKVEAATGDQKNTVPAPPEQPPAPAPASDDHASAVLAVGAGPAVGLGLTPDAAAFGRLFVAARFRHVSVEVAGDAAVPVTQSEPDGTGVVLHALGSTAAGCGHASFVSACLLGRLGWLRARGTGIALPSTSWGHFTELGLRVAGTRDVGRFSLSVHADGLVMLSRWNVVLNDAVVWSIPRFGALLGLDVALRFF